MARTLSFIALRAVIILALIIGIYYWLVPYPQIAARNSLKQTEITLGQTRARLVERSLLLEELQRLDIQSSNFNAGHSRIISSLQSSASWHPTELTIDRVYSGSPSSQYVDETLRPQLKKLTRTRNEVIKAQQSVIDTILAYSQVVSKLYEYQPISDLIRVDKPKKFELLASRSKAAIAGLDQVKGKTADSVLREQISQTQTSLTQLVTTISSGDIGATESARQSAIEQFNRLRAAALATEVGLIKTAEGYHPSYVALIREIDNVSKRLSEERKTLN